MNANKHATRTEWIDPDDAPELTDVFFERADEFIGNQLVRRGRHAGANRKLSVRIQCDADIVAAFKSAGKGWQNRMNDALKDWLTTHPQG